MNESHQQSKSGHRNVSDSRKMEQQASAYCWASEQRLIGSHSFKFKRSNEETAPLVSHRAQKNNLNKKASVKTTNSVDTAGDYEEKLSRVDPVVVETQSPDIPETLRPTPEELSQLAETWLNDEAQDGKKGPKKIKVGNLAEYNDSKKRQIECISDTNGTVRLNSSAAKLDSNGAYSEN